MRGPSARERPVKQRLVRALGRATPFDAVEACNPPDGMLRGALQERRRGAALVVYGESIVW